MSKDCFAASVHTCQEKQMPYISIGDISWCAQAWTTDYHIPALEQYHNNIIGVKCTGEKTERYLPSLLNLPISTIKPIFTDALSCKWLPSNLISNSYRSEGITRSSDCTNPSVQGALICAQKKTLLRCQRQCIGSTTSFTASWCLFNSSNVRT